MWIKHPVSSNSQPFSLDLPFSLSIGNFRTRLFVLPAISNLDLFPLAHEYAHDFGLWTLDFRLWTLNFGLWTLDFGITATVNKNFGKSLDGCPPDGFMTSPLDLHVADQQAL